MSAPPQLPPMPNKEDGVATWKFLQIGVDRIMKDLEKGMDMKMYMALYTAIHNFCTAQKPVGSGTFTTHQNRGGAHLIGEDLYTHLIDYLRHYLKAISDAATQHVDEGLLSYYIVEWDRYTKGATYNNHLFQYLNRHWVKREMNEGKKNIYDIYSLHLVRWREDMFVKTHSQVMDAVLRLVEKQRNGETIEHQKIKSIVTSFVSLGMDEADPTKMTIEVYREYFEKPYLEATTAYYNKESVEFLSDNSVVEYMKKAEVRLAEEVERAKMYLITEIEQPLKKTCETALIARHSITLRDEFQTLLDNDKQEDLGRMYKLLSRIPDGLDPLRARFETHVRKAGLAAVSRINADGDNIEPKVYVDALLDVHAQYHQLVMKAFTGESEFVRALDNACKEFVNRNSLCRSGSSRSPELLAKYTDSLLKKSTAKMNEEDDMEKMLTQIMTVFKYIEDKDVFQKFYSRMLAKRLVQTTSASDDAETSMISKLKEACGFEYTNKLQRMFQDIQTSKDLNSDYAAYLDKADLGKDGVDSNFHILGAGFWPLTPPSGTFVPPEPIVRARERFEVYYVNKHQGRKLTWLWQLCKGEVRANHVRLNRVPYTLQVSTYQMAILLLFNDTEKLSYEEIAEHTRLSPDTLDPSLAVCVKARVFTVEPEGAKPEAGTMYKLNYGFKHKKVKVNLNIGIKSEQKQEADDTHKTIEEDRKLLMQSAIVRIMKSRKKMKHAQLVSETIAQIKSRFMPKVSDIKKCIDSLLEKEYLERLEGDELGYLA